MDGFHKMERDGEGEEERARMMKRTLTASPKVLPFTFRFPLPPSLSLSLQVSSKRQNSAKSSLPLLPQRDITRQQRQHDPLTICHPVVISLSQAAVGFLRGSEFQFSPPFPCFPPIPSFPPSFKEFECNLGLLIPSLPLSFLTVNTVVSNLYLTYMGFHAPLLFRSLVKYIQPEFGTPAFPEPLTHSLCHFLQLMEIWPTCWRSGVAWRRPRSPSSGRSATAPTWPTRTTTCECK